MQKKRVLIVEDVSDSLNMIKDLLESEDYEVSIAQNGKEAFELFMQSPFPVVITDINMPVMDGNELINKLRSNASDIEPIIIVETVHDEPEYIIDIMKKGVFDYLIKPINMDDLLIKIQRAFEFATLKRTAFIIKNEKIIRLQNHLRGVDPNINQALNEENEITDLAYRMHTIFNQGSGIGTMVTLLEYLITMAKQEGENYVIKSSFIDIIKQNTKYVKTILTFLEELYTLTTETIEKETLSLPDFCELIKHLVDETASYRKINNHNLKMIDFENCDRTISLNINSEIMSNTLKELFINAYKFSKVDSTITCSIARHSDQITMTLINNPEPISDELIGIPMKYENIIFEPFFRISKLVYEDYKTLDYGLGLSYVQAAIQKHDGIVNISNSTKVDSKTGNSETFVIATIILPIK